MRYFQQVTLYGKLSSLREPKRLWLEHLSISSSTAWTLFYIVGASLTCASLCALPRTHLALLLLHLTRRLYECIYITRFSRRAMHPLQALVGEAKHSPNSSSSTNMSQSLHQTPSTQNAPCLPDHPTPALPTPIAKSAQHTDPPSPLPPPRISLAVLQPHAQGSASTSCSHPPSSSSQSQPRRRVVTASLQSSSLFFRLLLGQHQLRLSAS
jgi:hypothetical protein